jgi:hypothetical protein
MENWKPVVGYEGIYEVSDQGRVKRIKPEYNTYVGKILSGGIEKNGYRVVLLYDNGKRKMFKVHRLVAIAFVPNPENKPQINHKNAIKLDNRAENLEWSTCQENITHAVNKGLWNAAKGEQHGQAKLKDIQIPTIRSLLKIGYTCNDISVQFKVSRITIEDIKAKRTWKWL